MINIAICDDEKYFREEIEKSCKQYLHEKKQEYEIFMFGSGEALMECKVQPDIVFLDIEMGELTGLDVAQQLLNYGDKMTFVVYVTGHQEYVMEAFDINVLGFLEKPVSYAKIQRMFEKAETRMKRFKTICQYNGRNVPVCEVVYMEAEGSYTRIWLMDGKCFIERKNLGEWEIELERYGFYRIHKSQMINMQFVKKYEKEKREVYAKDRKFIVARRKAKNFQEAYEKYIAQGIWG